MSQPAKAVWIEIVVDRGTVTADLSQPAKAVWIEMTVCLTGRLEA